MMTENQTNNLSLDCKISQILCPTDLTPTSDGALQYATALADAFKATLLILHSVDNDDQIEDQAQVESLFSESIGQYMVDHNPHIVWQGVVASDPPAEAIVTTAKEKAVDLIVMRSRRRPLAAALLGSTTEAVCHAAPCPVLVTHPEERDILVDNKLALHKILVAYDFSPDAHLALTYALGLAQAEKAEIHLLHILTTAPENPLYARFKSSRELAKAALQAEIGYDVWPNMIYEVREGSIYSEILHYAQEKKIDLISLGAVGTSDHKPLFGSNVDYVLRKSPCPILVARSA